jgi:hypothetical protein
VVVASLSAALLLLLAPVMLQGQQQARPRPTLLQPAPPQGQPFSLTVAPPRIIIAYTPGEAVVRTVEVINGGASTVHVDGLLSEFSQQPDGSIHFASPSGDSGASWVAVRPDHFAIAPQATQRVEVSVTVPANADQGERQIGLVLRVPAPAGSSGNMTVTGAIGVEVLIGAPGAVTETTQLGMLHAPGFSFGGPVPLSLTVSERGNVHREFVAPQQLYADAAGTKVYFPGFIVLKGVTRTITTSWRQPPLLCRCTVTIRTDDGHGHLLSASTTVIVFPLTTVIGVLVLAVGLVILARVRRNRRRGRHQAEVEAARREAYELARLELLAAGTEAKVGGSQAPGSH